MKTLKKITTGGFVAVLVLFAGSFCIHSMPVEAAFGHTAMGGSQNGADMNDSGCIAETDTRVSGMTVCISDCIAQTPQAVVSKKTSADNLMAVAVVATFGDEQSEMIKLPSDPSNVTGTSPPTLDILSSVVKRE